jgi:hypothetical protein
VTDRLSHIRAASARARADRELAAEVQSHDVTSSAARCPHGTGPATRCSQCIGVVPTKIANCCAVDGEAVAARVREHGRRGAAARWGKARRNTTATGDQAGFTGRESGTGGTSPKGAT